MATKKASSGNKKVYLIAGAILLGVAGYFGYNWWKKRKDAKDTGSGGGSTDTNVNSGSTDTNVGSGSGSGSGSSSTTTTTSNPFKTPEEVLKFQQWVINTKKDKTILGTGGSTGYGDDGKWGSKSANAWDKYGKEYLTGTAGSGSGTKVYANLDKDIKTIIDYCTGQKAEKSYLSATALKYPAFVQNWAEAVRKRLSSGGKQGTTFIFANQIYDSYRADKISSTLLIGKTAYKKDGDVYVFEEASRYSANYNLSGSEKERGIVKSYFYNIKQGIFFLYIPSASGSTYKWYPYSAIEKFI
jgi:hypothetical protein